MSIDDIRARQEAFTKTLADFQTAMAAAAKSAASGLQQLLTEATGIAADIEAYTPPPNPAPGPASPVDFALFCYNNPAIDASWPAQTLQGQPETVKRLPALRAVGVKKLYRYTHPLTWTDHPDRAVRAGVDPAVFKREWLAKRGGQPIKSTKFDSGDGFGNYLIDVGNLEYQKASAAWMIWLCRTQGWDGIYLDEVNELLIYAGYRVPDGYANDYRFQASQLAYVTYVAAELKKAGFECHVNVAAGEVDWRKHIAQAVDGTHIEFWMAQWTVNDPDSWHVASLENGEFRRQMDWVAWNEKAGKVTTCQADARTEAEVDYALASLLLVTTGKARFAARRDRSYGVGQGWWTPAMDTARLLGQPKAAYTRNVAGLHQRDFEHGRVLVNPTLKPVGGLPATSGRIELTSP